MTSVRGLHLRTRRQAPGRDAAAVAHTAGRRRRRVWGRYATGYAFVLPFLVMFVLFWLYPNLKALKLSFEQYSGYGNATWVGFANYRAFLSYPVFWTELWNTLFYWVVHAVILVPLALILALLVRSPRVKGGRFWRPLIFLPQVFNIVVISLTFKVLFSTNFGVINSLFGTRVPWLDDPALARWVVVALLVWEQLGFWFVVFLAGLSTLDPALEEAASIDGAGMIRRVWSIILPALRPVILFAVVIDAINSMALYTEPNVLTAPSGQLAQPSVGTLSNLVVTTLEGGDFGRSAAAGWLLFVVTIVVSCGIFGLYKLTGGSLTRAD
jgi:ABC-type sugar transport system permease subunit